MCCPIGMMSEQPNRKVRIQRNLLWFVAAVFGFPALTGLVIWAGFQFVYFDVARSYPHNPQEFQKQVEAIRPGMTEADVAGVVTKFSETTRSDNKVLYLLRPTRKPFVKTAPTLTIDVDISSETKLVEKAVLVD